MAVVVRSGSFMTGSPGGEGGRCGDESPVHRVRIAEPNSLTDEDL